MVFIWLSIIIFLVIVEGLTVQLTTVWFVVSGLLALVLSLFVDSIELQFAIFVLGGVLLLITTRPYLIRKLNVKEARTNLDRVIGMEGVVTENVGKHKTGEVKVDGKRWTAISDEEIKENEIVEIIKIEGVKLKVRKK